MKARTVRARLGAWLLSCLAAAAAAEAHPLLQGVGTQSIFTIRADRIRVRFNLGFSPVKSFEFMSAADRNQDYFIDAGERDAFIAGMEPVLLAAVKLAVDGVPVPLRALERSGDTFYGEVGQYASDLWYTFEGMLPPAPGDAVRRAEYVEGSFSDQVSNHIAWIPFFDQGEGVRFRILEPESSAESDTLRAIGRKIVFAFTFSPAGFAEGEGVGPGPAAPAAEGGAAPPAPVRPETYLDGVLGEGSGKACIVTLPPGEIRILAAIAPIEGAAADLRRRADANADGRIGEAEEDTLLRNLGEEIIRALTVRQGDQELRLEITSASMAGLIDLAVPLRFSFEIEGKRPDIPRGAKQELYIRALPLPSTRERPDIWIPLRGNDIAIGWTVTRPAPEIGSELVRLRGGEAAIDLVRLGPAAGPPPPPPPAGAAAAAAAAAKPSGEGRFLTLFSDYLRGRVGFWLLVFFCLAYGMGHALTPGHGKALVAAYLIGTRGQIRDAVALGLTTTVTHTAVVYIFAIAGAWLLGITAAASTGYINEITVAMQILSGLLVIGMGIFVFRRFGRRHQHAHPHDHPDADAHGHGHAHAHVHGHAHGHGDRPRLRELLGFGISGGAVPCPTLLVILIVLLPQYATLPDKTIIFLPLIAFSLGLGGVLTGIGIALVTTKRFVAGKAAGERWASRSALGRLVMRALPKLPRASAVVIMILGGILVADAVRRGSFEIANLLRALADWISPAR